MYNHDFIDHVDAHDLDIDDHHEVEAWELEDFSDLLDAQG